MRSLIIATILLMATLACKKDKKSSNANLIGKWNLVLTTGGLAGLHVTPAQTGHTKSYVFEANNFCTIINDGRSGTSSYYVKNEYSQTYQKNVDMLYLGNTDKQQIDYAHDTLVLSYDIALDGTSDWFVKE